MFGNNLTYAQKNPDYKTFMAQQAKTVRDHAKAQGRDTVGSGTPNDILMDKDFASGKLHTYYYNAAQNWRKGGRQGKYTPPSPPGSQKKAKRYDTPTGHRHVDYRKSAYEPQSGTISAPRTASSNPSGYNSKSSIQQPRYISDDATQDSINNTLAQGYANADGRFQTKNLDRAGFSRGSGQKFMAAQEGVQQMQKAADSASEVRASDQRVNDQMRSDYQRAVQQETMNNAMIAHSMDQAAWQRNFAQQSLAAQLNMAAENAQLQIKLALLR